MFVVAASHTDDAPQSERHGTAEHGHEEGEFMYHMVLQAYL